MYPREQPRLAARNYLGRRAYFVTICTHNRAQIFANPRLATWMVQLIRRYAMKNRFHLHAWCVMPDHVHILVEGATSQCDLRKFVSALKQNSAAAFDERFRRRLWQRYFYDHIVRTNESTHRIAAYIWMNPVRKGICADLREYAFAGSMTYAWSPPECSGDDWVPPWKEGSKQD